MIEYETFFFSILFVSFVFFISCSQQQFCSNYFRIIPFFQYILLFRNKLLFTLNTHAYIQIQTLFSYSKTTFFLQKTKQQPSYEIRTTSDTNLISATVQLISYEIDAFLPPIHLLQSNTVPVTLLEYDYHEVLLVLPLI
jgi:hypothetical protein